MSGGRERTEPTPPRLRALQIYLCGTEQEPCVMCGLFPSEYTIYVIMVLWEGVEWQIRKRYSEFRYLHDFLLSKFGNRLVSRLPPFPGKSYNPITHKAPSFIETRAGELALWLQSLCVYKEVIANPSFIDWMEMPQEAVLTIHERSDSERDNARPAGGKSEEQEGLTTGNHRGRVN